MSALPEVTEEMLDELEAAARADLCSTVVLWEPEIVALVAWARRGLAAARAEEELRGMVAATEEADRGN